MTEDNITKLQNILGDRYDVAMMIYRGGMGEVYLGRHRQLESKVAIKIMTQKLSDDPEQKKRFHREAQLYANLRHPNIIPISDFGSDEFFDYMVFPFIEGENLQEKLKHQGRLDTDEALNIMIAVAKALAYASSNNVIHRDVKPSNIMIERNGNVLMADFGISKDLRDMELTVPGTVLGSPKYMSPEQLLGKEVDSRSDQYALGLIFFEMIAGRFPYAADDTTALFYSHVNENPKLSDDIIAQIGYEIPAIIKKLTAKNPADRYDSFNTLIEDLKSTQSDQTKTRPNIHPHSALTKNRKTGLQISTLRMMGIGFLLILVVSGSFFYYRAHRIPDVPVSPIIAQDSHLPAPAEKSTPAAVPPPAATLVDEKTDSGALASTPDPIPTIADLKEALFNFGKPDSSGWYQITLNKPEFQIGDEIAYSIKARKDCHFVLLDFSTSNELVQLFPNQFHPDSLIRANTRYTIPAKGSFEVTGPAGSETVIGYAGESYFQLIKPDFSAGPFLSFTDADSEGLIQIQENIQNLKDTQLIRKNIDFLIFD